MFHAVQSNYQDLTYVQTKYCPTMVARRDPREPNLAAMQMQILAIFLHSKIRTCFVDMIGRERERERDLYHRSWPNDVLQSEASFGPDFGAGGLVTELCARPSPSANES